MSGGYRGVSLDQDVRYSNKDSELLKTTKFPSAFKVPVDMTKVSMPVMRPWIAEKVEELLGFEDEVVAEMVTSALESERVRGAWLAVR